MRKFLLFSALLLVLAGCGTARLNRFTMPYKPPKVENLSGGVRKSAGNVLAKNEYGLWELRLAGDALALGLLNGALTDSLFKLQEEVFFAKVGELVPSRTKQWVLRKFLAWYNRKLPRSIPLPFRHEIYGLSRYAGDSLNFIAKPYARSLYLHGAHDIGHALQDLAMVGCTSFAAWGEHTEDGQLLIGRNFDFYAGDDFAKNKVIAVVQPDVGYGFLSVTWPGMIGVVSGMNTEGLTVTINAGKSAIPLKARTPISLLVREILQHARTIDEAVQIAMRRKVFVSESIMVGSALDNRAVLIELSPRKVDVFAAPNTNKLVCTNHFQSASYRNDKRNIKQMRESHSVYRYERVNELLAQASKVNVEKAVALLRNRDGLANQPIGWGNEKALNHLLAHHSVVFQPAKRKVWVSAPPYQLGAFVAYDLNELFQGKELPLFDATATLPEDSFVRSRAYRDYERYRALDSQMDAALRHKRVLPEAFIEEYISLNPELWSVYYKAGKYFKNQHQLEKARRFFETALTKEIATLPARREIEKNL